MITPLTVCPGRSIVRAIRRLTCSSCRAVTVRARIGVWSWDYRLYTVVPSQFSRQSLAGLGVGNSDFVKSHHGRLDQ